MKESVVKDVEVEMATSGKWLDVRSEDEKSSMVIVPLDSLEDESV